MPGLSWPYLSETGLATGPIKSQRYLLVVGLSPRLPILKVPDSGKLRPHA